MYVNIYNITSHLRSWQRFALCCVHSRLQWPVWLREWLASHRRQMLPLLQGAGHLARGEEVVSGQRRRHARSRQQRWAESGNRVCLLRQQVSRLVGLFRGTVNCYSSVSWIATVLHNLTSITDSLFIFLSHCYQDFWWNDGNKHIPSQGC